MATASQPQGAVQMQTQGEECAMVRYETLDGLENTDGLVLTSAEAGEIQVVGPLLPPPPHSLPPQTLHVNGEEIAIFLIVICIWIGAISLFYHQWSKIRGINDYQPDYAHTQLTFGPFHDSREDGSDIGNNSLIGQSPVEGVDGLTTGTSGAPVTPSTNLLYAFGRQGRRASRSFADLYALKSMQRTGLYLPHKKRQHLIEINHTSKSMDDQSCPLQIQISCDDDITDSTANLGKVNNIEAVATSVTSNANQTSQPPSLPSRPTYPGIGYRLADCRPARSYDRDISECSQNLRKGRHGQSILALHKDSTGSGSVRSFSPDVTYVNETSGHLPHTKRYLTAANRHLAASTLRLWQTGSGGSASVMASASMMRPPNKRKTRSYYNLQEFI